MYQIDTEANLEAGSATAIRKSISISEDRASGTIINAIHTDIVVKNYRYNSTDSDCQLMLQTIPFEPLGQENFVFGIAMQDSEQMRIMCLTERLINRTFLILSQFQKFGSLITVIREETAKSDVFTIKTILGKDDDDTHVAARYIAEQMAIVKPLLISICLKDYSIETLRHIVAAIKKLQSV